MGNNWTKKISGTTSSLLSVSFGNLLNGIAVGSGGTTVRTTDGGLTWNVKSSGTSLQLYSISRINSKIFHAVSQYGYLVSTIDSGLTWTLKSPGVTPVNSKGITFSDFNNGIIVGEHHIKRTSDGGNNWSYIGTRLQLNALSVTGNLVGTAVGKNGVIVRTFSPDWLQDQIHLVYPSDGAIDIPIDSSATPPFSIVFRWNLFPYLFSDLACYKIEIAPDSRFNKLLAVKQSNRNVKDTTMLISIFHTHKKYYWRVNAIDEGWDVSSDKWSFIYGPPRFGVINGLVFEDKNRNCIKDIDERGLSDWRVIISGEDQPESSTNELGEYCFDFLDSGKYIIGIIPKSNWEITYPSSEFHTITLGMNDTILAQNFGVRYRYEWCSVDGVVFNDRNENGIRDNHEPGIPNRLVKLTGYESDFVLTDSSGNYSFSNLYASVYEIKAENSPGWEQIVPRDQGGYLIEFRSYGERVTDNDFAMRRTPVRVKLQLSVKDNYPMKANLYWGIRPGATYGIWGADPQATNYDFSEGEYELPPVIYGFFDVRFVDPTLATNRFGLGAYTDMRDFTSVTGKYTYRINFSPGKAWGADYPMTFNWSRSNVQQSFPNGSVELVDKYGSRFDMKTRDSLVISDRSITYLKLFAQGPDIPAEYLKSWKMISLPVDVIDSRIGTIFRISNSKAFSYSSNLGYRQTDTLVPGMGYWLKCSWMLDTSQFIGMPRFNDTIPIYEGWNMIGTLSVPMPVSSITTIPSGLVNEIFFGYSGGYIPIDTLKPFQAYWVKSRGDGDLVLDAWGGAAQKGESKYAAFERTKERCNSLIIQDAMGNEQELYFTTSDDNIDITSFELPPIPPSGLFDARYGSNCMIELIEEGKEKEVPIMISSGEYPITLRWRLNSSTVTASLKIDGNEILLLTNGNTQISHPISHISIVLRGVPNIPQEFSLEQNYPNPFNQVTVIRYQLPDESEVALKIYNILGQEVVTLVDRIEDAGYKSVEWDAAGQASGVYIYKLEATRIANYAEAFTQVRKMILIR